jgi:chromosome segregation ATPase
LSTGHDTRGSVEINARLAVLEERTEQYNEISHELKQIGNHIAKQNGSIPHILDHISAVETDVGTIQQDVVTIREAVATTSADIGNVKTTVNNLTESMSGSVVDIQTNCRSTVTDIKGDVSEVSKRTSVLETKQKIYLGIAGLLCTSIVAIGVKLIVGWANG